MKFFRIFTVIALLSLCSGCSIKIAYHFLDNILGWQLNSYIDLNSAQKQQADTVFKQFHLWHREDQLPIYAEYFGDVRDLLDLESVSAESLHKESDRLQDMIDVSFQEILPGLVDVISTLSDEQVEDLLKNLAKESQDYKEKYVDISEAKRKKLNIKEIESYTDRFFGRYTDQQEALIEHWVETISPYESLMYAQKKLWETDVKTALALRHDKEKLKQELSKLVFYRTDNWEKQLQDILDTNQEHTFTLLADLFNSRTPRQRERTRDKIDGYIKTCNDLSITKKTD